MRQISVVLLNLKEIYGATAKLGELSEHADAKDLSITTSHLPPHPRSSQKDVSQHQRFRGGRPE